MMTGGTAYIYELPTGGWSCKYKDSMTFWDTEGRLTFAGKNVMLPLWEDMIEHKLIPAKEAIIDKVKVAYVLEEKDIPMPATVGHACLRFGGLSNLMLAIYGAKSVWNAIPDLNRYYYIPIISEDEKANLPKSIKTLNLNTRDKPKKIVDALNQLYPPIDCGNAFVTRLGPTYFVVNNNEYKDISQQYSLNFSNAPVRKIEGEVSVHQYLIAKLLDNGTLFIHTCARQERKTSIKFSVKRKIEVKIIPESALVNSGWNEKNKTMTVTVSHKEGAVRLFLK